VSELADRVTEAADGGGGGGVGVVVEPPQATLASRNRSTAAGRCMGTSGKGTFDARTGPARRLTPIRFLRAGPAIAAAWPGCHSYPCRTSAGCGCGTGPGTTTRTPGTA